MKKRYSMEACNQSPENSQSDMSVQDLKNLPSVDQILSHAEVVRLLSEYPRKTILLRVNEVLGGMRKEICEHEGAVPSRE